jgi:hypothetical protein
VTGNQTAHSNNTLIPLLKYVCAAGERNNLPDFAPTIAQPPTHGSDTKKNTSDNCITCSIFPALLPEKTPTTANAIIQVFGFIHWSPAALHNPSRGVPDVDCGSILSGGERKICHAR